MEKAQASANIGFEKQIWDAACAYVQTMMLTAALYWSRLALELTS